MTDSNEDEHEHDPFRTVFVAIIFLFLMYFALYHLYICSCLPRSRRSHHHFRNHRPPMLFFPSNPSHTASRGLDPAVLKSLPVFVFSNVTHKDPIECAVCLSEFETGESGRVLPGCEHAFHVECIDMWFHSHSTCPLCRSLVESPAEIVIAISPEPVSAIEPDSTSGSGSSAMPLDGLRREPAATETTRRSFSDDLTRNSPANHLVTSPVSRMLSLMSRKGRSAPSSFAGAPSQPPSSSCQMVMNESNIERGGEEIKSGFRHVDVP